MKCLKTLAPLALALTCVTGGALAEPVAPPADVLPEEALKAIEALNLAGSPRPMGLMEKPVAAKEVPLVDDRVLAVGLGAIAGVVVFNLATGGAAAVPLLAGEMGGAGSAMGVGRGTVAFSRVYAVSSAVTGGLVGDYLYRKSQAGRMPSVPADVAARVSP